MSKTLVAFFSASLITKGVAETICETVCGDLFEIKPTALYTKEDLDYTNPQSRCSVEMNDLNCRPAVCAKVDNMDQYDTVYLGFPIWWGREPSVVDTFLDENCLAGKNVVVFATSGGSGVEDSAKRIAELTCGKANITNCVRFAPTVTVQEVKDCICNLK